MEIFLFIVFFIFLLWLTQSIVIRILLGYYPASWDCKNIDGEIRIYHNGLPEKWCIDEGDRCMDYYYVVPNCIRILFFTVDGYLDKFQSKAIERRNLRS